MPENPGGATSFPGDPLVISLRREIVKDKGEFRDREKNETLYQTSKRLDFLSFFFRENGVVNPD
jgi:hypothetical protein